MGKKMGINSKAEEGRARKAATKEAEKEKVRDEKQKQEELKALDDASKLAPHEVLSRAFENFMKNKKYPEKHKIDYIIHGDDPCLLPDGTDAYAHAKKLGRFKLVGRRRVPCLGVLLFFRLGWLAQSSV